MTLLVALTEATSAFFTICKTLVWLTFTLASSWTVSAPVPLAVAVLTMGVPASSSAWVTWWLAA